MNSKVLESFAFKLLLSVVAVFAPIQGMLGAALTLIMADLVTGVWAARKLGKPITSSGLKRTVVKLLVYEGVIALGWIGEHYLMSDMIPVAKIAAGYIGLTELTSAYENINNIAGNDLLKGILDKLNSKG